MKKSLLIFVALLSFLFVATFSAIADQGHKKPYVGLKAFERMKQLEGNWEGSMQMGEQTMKMKASYKLTSGGSTLVETTHEGAPHEMVSVYHDNKKKKMVMTHYCSEQNQPKLILAAMDNNKLSLDLASDSDIDVANEKHIHSVVFHFNGADKMTQTWTSYAAGKQDMIVKMEFTYVK